MVTITKCEGSEVIDPVLFAKATQACTLIIGSLKESMIDLPQILEFFLRNKRRILFLTTGREAQQEVLGFLVRNEFPLFTHLPSQPLSRFSLDGIHLLTLQLFAQRVPEEHLQKAPFDLVIFWGVEKLGHLKAEHPLRKLLPLLPEERLAYGERFRNETDILRICQLLDLKETHTQDLVGRKINVLYVPLPGSYLSVLTALEHLEGEIRTEASQEGINLPLKGRKSLIMLQQRLSREYDGNPVTSKTLVYTAMLIRLSQLRDAITESGLIRSQELLKQWYGQRNKVSIQQLLAHPKITLLSKLVQRYPLPHPKFHILTEQLNTQEAQRCLIVATTEASARTIYNSMEGKINLFLPKMKAAERRRVLEAFQQHKTPLITTLGGLNRLRDVELLICWQPMPFHNLEGLGSLQKLLVLVTKGTAEEGIYWKYHHQYKRFHEFVQDDVKISVERLQEHRETSISETNEYLDKFVPQSLGRKEEKNPHPRYLEVVERLLPLVQPLSADPTWTVKIVPSSKESLPYLVCDSKNVFVVIQDEELIQTGHIIRQSIEYWQLKDKIVRVLCYTGSAILHRAKVISKIVKITDEMGVSVIFQPIQADEQIATLVQELLPQPRQRIEKPNLVNITPDKTPELKQIWIQMLIGIPGINHRKAVAILDHFGSFWALMREGESSKLEAVPGIGAKLAKRISEALGFEKEPD
ncbi:MAG: helix-hairpin-helix domain-containing protein [Candidatus Hodarchaeota archaeon]